MNVEASSADNAQVYASAILKEKPGFAPAILELERLKVCARCCLRFAAVRTDVYGRKAPTTTLLRQALERAVRDLAAADGGQSQDAAAPSEQPGAHHGTSVNGSAAANESHDEEFTSAAGSSEAEPVCRVCLGVLQSLEGPLHPVAPEVWSTLPDTDGSGAQWQPQTAGDPQSIADHVRGLGYDGGAFGVEISVPGSTQLRQLAMWYELKSLPATAHLFQGETLRDDAVDLKESLRLRGFVAQQLEKHLGKPLNAAGGDLRITLNYIHPGSAAETDFLFSRPFGGRSQKRKRRRTATPTIEVGRSSSETIAAAAAKLSSDAFRSDSAVPPLPASTPVSLMVSCRRTPLFIGGCYRKLQRDVSQSPWIIDGVRKGRTSVQEEIERVLLPALRCDSAKFITAGREDIDVRMLGDGRPFVMEIQNQRASMPPPERFAAMEYQLEESGVGVEVRKLQPVDKERLQAIKDGEQRKQKSYRAVCELPCPVTPEIIEKINGLKEVELDQTTPTRVEHRRAMLVRKRTVHTMTASPLEEGQNRISLLLRTQAGTYVKEFVHGDEGRTQPNLGSLLGCEVPAEILELDVLGIHMDFL